MSIVDYWVPIFVLYGLVAVGLFGAALCESKGVLAALMLSVLWPFVLAYLVYISSKE